MMTAVKDNRAYDNITEAEKQSFIDAGYDIIEDGEVIAYGKGKMISIEAYMALKAENNSLKAELEKLQKKEEKEEKKAKGK